MPHRARGPYAALLAIAATGCAGVRQPELSFGGRLREQFEHYTNRDFGLSPPEHDTYLLHRLLVNGRASWDDAIAVDVELINALAPFKESEIAPIDENALGVQRAHVDVRPDGDLRLRLGRQELQLGRGRLVSVREGPNVRRNFDGARLTIGDPTNGAGLDAFALFPVEPARRVFDDEVDGDEFFWGAQAATTPIDESAVGPGRLETYYLGRYRDRARYDAVVGSEHRHSFGVRWAGPVWADATGLRVDFEAVAQVGRVGDRDIAAWTASSSWTRPFDTVPWRPKPGVRLDVISGDPDPDDGTLETFDALYPNNSYFSEAAIFAPANLFDVNASFACAPRDDLSVELLWDFLWRYATDDGVYVPPGIPAIAGDASDRRFLGHSISLNVTWQVRDDVDATATFTHFEAGAVVEDAGGRDVDSVAAWVNWRF